MRTAESVPPALTGSDALISLLGYMAVYLIIFPAGVIVIARIVRRGPAAGPEAGSPMGLSR
jgi:cytochrome d ubiquinol oxidase subunit I